MFKNMLKVALRNLKKTKIYSLINVSGLALSMAVCILIFIWVQDELSFDKFHKKAKQIYRVAPVVESSKIKLAYSPPPLAQALKKDFPEVLHSTRLETSSRNTLVGYGNKNFLENQILFAESNIFDVFTIPFLEGNPKTALSEPKSVVLTKKTASKYFGDQNPIGKSIFIKDIKNLYQITGVVKNCPQNSNLQYDFIVATDFNTWGGWGSHCLFTYIVLPPNYSPALLENKFPGFIRSNLGGYIQKEYGKNIEEYFGNKDNFYNFWVQPLTDIHLNNYINDNLPNKGNKNQVIIFSIIAFFILGIACINFINLSTARSINRAEEIGLRKVIGAKKSSLIGQFLTESVLLSFFSMVFTILIIELIRPFYSVLIQKRLIVGYFDNPLVIPGLIGISLLVGIIAGLYPAFYLSSLQPVAIFKDDKTLIFKGKNVRNGLVIFQFSISIFILLSIIVVFKQTKFVQNTELGFNQEQVLVIHGAPVGLGNKMEVFTKELKKYPDILSISNTSSLPGRHFNPNGHRLENTPISREYTLYTMYTDHNFVNLLNLQMVEGRYFSAQISSDKTNAVIINEAAVNKLGLADPVGKRFLKEYGGAKKGEYVTIIGVLKNFHFQSLHHKIQPMIIRNLGHNGKGFYLSLKIQSNNLTQILALIEKKWETLAGGHPFQYSFLDNDFDKLYQKEAKVSKILGIFFILSILVAGLGLFGLTSFIVEQRKKEISIRKVLGSSLANIFYLLNKNFIKLVILSNIIAFPFAFFFMSKWLQGYAYHITVDPVLFLISLFITLTITLLTVSFQTIKATLANPVDNLRKK